MKVLKRLYWMAAAAILAGISLASPVRAEVLYRLDTPGTSFVLERGKAMVDDVAGGRRFRGQAHSTLVLRGNLRIPPAATADPEMLRLVVHFRTSAQGPSLQSVALGSGSVKTFHIDTNLRGDLTGETKANTWDFAKGPVRIGSDSLLRLEVGFPGGFDSVVDPGEFVLTSVSVHFARKLANASPSATIAGSTAQKASIAASGPAYGKPTIAAATGQTVRLDWCRVWGGECGKPAADAYCQSKGYASASTFQIDEDIGNTAIITSGAICAAPSCDGFSRIECKP